MKRDKQNFSKQTKLINEKIKMTKFTKKDFLENLMNDKLKNFSIVHNLASESSKRFELLNKNKREILTFNATTIAIKISDLLKSYKLEDTFISENEIYTYIKNVDVVTEEITEPNGFKQENDLSYYNYIIETKIERQIKAMLKDVKKEEFENCFRFNRYPHIDFLIDHLLNVNNENNKTTVDIKKHFLNWIANCLQYKEKTGMAYVFISQTHGTGKGVFASILNDFFTELYYAEINNDTMTQQFNGILHNKRFVCFNESEIDYRDYEKASSKLKVMIADKSITLRQMRKDQTNVQSCFNMLINSNSKTPFKIENSDRRMCVIHNSIKPLNLACREEFGISIQDFVNNVKAEQIEFLKDLMNLAVDKKMSTFNAFNNNAKKFIINNTNTQINNLSSLIENKDIDNLIEYFFDVADSEYFEKFLNEVSAGYLSNEIVNGFLSENFREQDLSKASKKIFWDKKFGESKKVNYKSLSGVQKQARVRILSGFDPKRLEELFNADVLPFENIQEEEKSLLKDKKIKRLKDKFGTKVVEEFKESDVLKTFSSDDLILDLSDEDLESIFE